MSEHRVIHYDRRFKGGHTLAGTAGIYGLADPRDMRVRYVGSSNCIEHRVYSHAHSTGSGATPKAAWIRQLAAAGVKPCAVLLEAGDFGLPQSAQRLAAERRWIETYSLVGDADLNVTLTALGSEHSKDSTGKRLHHELRQLRLRVIELETELANLHKVACNACNTAQRCTRCTPPQPDSLQRNATPPFRGVACCSGAASKVAESANFADWSGLSNPQDLRETTQGVTA